MDLDLYHDLTLLYGAISILLLAGIFAAVLVRRR